MLACWLELVSARLVGTCVRRAVKPELSKTTLKPEIDVTCFRLLLFSHSLNFRREPFSQLAR